MAATTLATAGAAIVANAATVASAASLTTDNATAIGNLLIVLGRRQDLALEVLKILNSTELNLS